MAMIDYGAMLRVDGKFINRSQFFMETSDTGYVLESATFKDGKVRDIMGNYFVYAGDENFMVVFYKLAMYVIKNGVVIGSTWGTDFKSEKMIIDGHEIKISHLDGMVINDYVSDICNESIEEWSCCDSPNKRTIRNYRRIMKRVARFRRKHDMDYNRRCLADWNHNGKHYEVIFGYGIENDESVWNEIKDSHYNFTEKEKEIIKSWFDKE